MILSLTESLAQAIAAAETETGKPWLEIDPWTLPGGVWVDLTDAMIESGIDLTR